MVDRKTDTENTLNSAVKSGTPGVSDPISNKLKELYRSVEDESIPDRFLDLLEQLDAAEQKTDGKQP